MKRHLPIMVERAIAEVKALQTEVGSGFEGQVRQERAVSCKVGCSNCCHHPFLVTLPEGLLLYRWLSTHGRWTPSLRKRIEETRDKTLGLAFRVWLLSNIPCPLLEDHKCLAYEARPLHCRTTFSRGDPEMCHPHELGSSAGIIPNTEVIISYNNQLLALLKRLGLQGSLMPLAEAVLIGEAVDSGKIEIEESALQHAKDLFGA